MTGRQDDNFLPVYRLMSVGLEVEPIAAACTRNSTNNREREIKSLLTTLGNRSDFDSGASQL